MPLTPGAERGLVERGVPIIPDFVANAGAAAWAWWVIFGLVGDADSSRSMVTAHVRPLVARLMADWSPAGFDLRERARAFAARVPPSSPSASARCTSAFRCSKPGHSPRARS